MLLRRLTSAFRLGPIYLTERITEGKASNRQADVFVSEGMRRAGVEELREKHLGDDLGDIAAAVYMAMEYERRAELAG